MLLCVAHRTCLTDNGNFHLTRISHFVLNLLGDFTGKVLRLFVVNLVCTDNDTQLTACLDGLCLCHSRIGHGQLLKVVQALDVGFYDFAACSRACS